MIKRECLICKNRFETYKSRIIIGKGKFCSKTCSNKGLLGKITWNKGLHGDPRCKGFLFKHTKKTKKKMSKARFLWLKEGGVVWNKGTKGLMNPWNKGKKLSQFTNEKNPNWKGNRVGYIGLHTWVKRHKGEAIKCEFCGKEKTTSKSIQWANKSHKYLRNLDDFISLCVSCHRKYDFKFLRFGNNKYTTLSKK